MTGHNFFIFEVMRFCPIFLLLFFGISFAAQAQHTETRVLRGLQNGTVRQWETIEIGLRFPLQERQYRDFLTDRSKGRNPYSEHSIRMQFSCNGKSFVAQAFYMEDARADEAQNKYITRQSEWPWRVRFAVPDTGTWECVLLMGEPLQMAVPHSTGIRFQCAPGDARDGYLKIAPDNRRLEHADGSPFFILGQNIAWADEPVLRGHAGPAPVYIAGYYDVMHYMESLAASGGNYVRFIMVRWSTGLEEKETGVYEQDKAWALDSMMRLAEKLKLKVHFCLDLTIGFTIEPKHEWHPYRRTFQKEGMTAAEMLSDSNVVELFDNYIRYVYSRWAFSPSVASIEIMQEHINWNGYADHKESFYNYFAHAQRLLREELHSPHLLSTSQGEQNDIRAFSNSSISFIDVHNYTNNFHDNRWRYQITNRRSYGKLDKPFLFGEMGMIAGPVNACDPDDWEYCSDISMHNSLWATAFMGGMGAGLPWWQWKNDGYREANFPALRWFIDKNYQLSGYDEHERWSGNGLETFYTRSSNELVAAGWVHNTSWWWGNTMDSCRDRNGKRMLHPRDDDKAEKPESRAGRRFTITGLNRRTEYQVTFYSTREAGKVISTVQAKSGLTGRLNLEMPVETDCAFTIEMIIRRAPLHE
jgi:hypothetical protein